MAEKKEKKVKDTKNVEEVETVENVEGVEGAESVEVVKGEKETKKTSKKKTVTKEPNKQKEKISHGKKYRQVIGLVEKGKEYELPEAIELLKKTSISKFDSTVEIHVNLNIDTTKADQQIRTSVSLPAGLGKEKKVAVVAGPDKTKEAKDAGADIVGSQDLVERIEKGFLEFDVLVATPDMMAHVGKIGKILGTKGLMPNPKTGTVTNEVEKVVKDIKKGRAEIRPDKAGIVHAPVGKVSFKEGDLTENIKTFLSALHHAKPSGAKGTFIKGVTLTTTMGPGIRTTER